jgi:ATP-dependent Clp protease protease subunit
VSKNFWKFTNIAALAEPGEQLEAPVIELRIEGDIIADNDAWLYEWFDEVATSPNNFKNELNKYQGQDLIVWIDSYGGDVFAAAGIYNALKEHKGGITVKIDGKAMSAASVIAMAGDQILMSPVAMLMIHNPLTQASGDMYDMRKTADVLDAVKETIINAYVAKTGKKAADISGMMDDETWMSANVAVKNGFADGVLYADSPNDKIGNIKDFAYSRLAIANGTSSSIRKLFEMESKELDLKDTEQILFNEGECK